MIEVMAGISLLAFCMLLMRVGVMLRFKQKTLGVIVSELEYNPSVPGIQGASFNQAARFVKQQGGNEYDAAIAFMLIQIGVMLDSGGGNIDDSRAFIRDKYKLIESLIPKSIIGEDLFQAHIEGRRKPVQG